MEKIDELLAQLFELSKENKINLLDRVKANPALKPVLFQPVFDEGHGVATAAAISDHDKLVKRSTDAETALSAANKKIEKLSEQNPDTAKLHEQYRQEMDKLNVQIKAAQDAGIAQVMDLKRDNSAVLLEAALVLSGVDPDYAEVLALKPATRERIHVDEKSGRIMVMQPDKPDIPFAGTERDQIKAYAENLKGSIANPLFLKSSVAGNGTGDKAASDRNNTPPVQNASKDLYDSIRKTAEAEHANGRNRNATEELDRRTGVRR